MTAPTGVDMIAAVMGNSRPNAVTADRIIVINNPEEEKSFESAVKILQYFAKENISKNVQLTPHQGEIYTYEEAMERHKLALACAIVRQSKGSEKAYICLKAARVLRGWQES